MKTKNEHGFFVQCHDNRPHKTIEAAREWLNNPTEQNHCAADAYNAADADADAERKGQADIICSMATNPRRIQQ